MNNGFNLEGFLQTMLQSNPVLMNYWNQAVDAAKDKTPEELEQYTKNVCKERGLSLDDVKSQMAKFGIKL